MSIESRSNQYGAIFGDWHIRKLLGSGSGGKSAVFELCRENNGWQEYSALKVVSLIEERGTREEMTPYRVNEYSTAVREQRAQAEQEVRLMEQLRGKTNIVDYLDHQFCDWREENGFGVDLLIRMEKLTDLRSQLRKGRLFSDREIITIGMDICRALTICHGKNILHRDIKPENIFFNADGDYKLGDFGVSRIMSNASSAMASTGIGTITYAAPEQFTGQYDHRVDIYSLGLVLYELMNGNRLPFAASGYATQEAIQKRFTGVPIPMPANVNMRDARSAGLAKIIMKATAFYSGNRYQDAREMLRDLTALSDGAAAAAPETAVLSGDSSQTTILPPVSGQTTAYQPLNYTRETEVLRPVSFMPAENGDVYAPPIPPAPTPVPTPAPRKTSVLPLAVGAVVALVLLAGVLCIGLLRNQTQTPGHTHRWLNATCTAPQTCADCGETNGSPLGHSWQAATCDSPGICTRCGKTTGTSVGHNWTDATCTATATCSRCGRTNGNSLGHSWIDATNDQPKTCSTCGLSEGQSLHAQQQQALADTLESIRRQISQQQYLPALISIYEAQSQYDSAELDSLAIALHKMYSRHTIAAARYHSAKIRSDGTVALTGNSTKKQCSTNGWTNVVSISIGDYHIVGLRADGSVYVSGPEEYCAGVDTWTDIQVLTAGDDITVGLKSDGTVVTAGTVSYSRYELELLYTDSPIISVSAGYEHLAALHADGTVTAIGRNDKGQCNVYSWTNIVEISAGSEHTVGLCADGTVLSTGENDKSQCNTASWSNIIAVSAGDYFTMGLTADGRVVATGQNQDGQCNTGTWTNVTEIAAGGAQALGLRKDGLMESAGTEKNRVRDIDALYSASHRAAQEQSVSYPLSSCEIVRSSNEQGSTTDIKLGDWEDKFGNIYSNSLRFWVADLENWSDTEYIVYSLNAEFRELTLEIAAETTNARNGSTKISVYVDDTLVYESPWIDNDTPPVSETLWIEDATQIKIICTTSSAANCYSIVSAMLYK